METQIIETPIEKHKVEIKSWITGRDRRALRSVYLEASEVKISGDVPEIKEMSGKIIEQAENKMIEIAVVSIDGKKDKILDYILDMHDTDYEFVMKKINQVTSEKKNQ